MFQVQTMTADFFFFRETTTPLTSVVVALTTLKVVTTRVTVIPAELLESLFYNMKLQG